MHMANAAQSPFEALLTWQPTNQNEEVPDRNQRANTIKRWLWDYDIEVGNYASTQVITVTVADTTLVERVEEFPSVEMYVKLAFAINGGIAEKRNRFSW
jgi:hypothetical protein